ncbi:MAG TPA: crotonase/enoyl-CoA hydratase family protein, partial [Myxococcota bacterium]|nr:crotonase/enoyl-CoA hydratase family protein [Myxococcota bacterium]
MPVRVEKQGYVTSVIHSRPEARNAVDRVHAEALAAAFAEFERDENARVAVLFGDGGNFCAGADLKAVATARGNRVTPPSGSELPPGEVDMSGPMGPTRMQLSKPVIAAVAGYAVAGGLELALWCDLRVVEQSAVFGVFCRRWGVPLVDGGTIRLPRIVGQGRALDMILTGRGVSGEEALQFGLANRLVEPGETLAAAKEMARMLAAFPQLCLRGDRMSSYEQWSMDLPTAIANEYEHG